MTRVPAARKLSYRSQGRRFVKSAAFPRWIAVPSVLIVGLMLWLGVLSDPSGKLATPGLGSILYVAAVVGVAALLAYADRSRDCAGNDRLRNRLDSKPRSKVSAPAQKTCKSSWR
jgi:hypothetical protein